MTYRPETYNVTAYWARWDGVADDTAAINAAIADAASKWGWEVYIPTGTYKCLGALFVPYTGTNLPYQAPIRLRWDVSSWNGYWTGISLPQKWSVLDLRYSGGSTQLAKIETRGAWFFEIDHLVLKSGWTDNFTFFYTTNTTVFIHHNVFSGNAANTGNTCLQDAIILGWQNEANIQTNADDAAFQWYGTIVSSNFYEKIRRPITFGCQCNNVVIENETVSKTCGSAGAIDAPFYFTGKNYGNIIRWGTVEIEGYKYMAVCMWVCEQNTFDTVWVYDNQAYTVGGIYFDTPAVYNTVIPGHFDPDLQPSYMAWPSAALNTVFSAWRNLPTFLSQGMIIDTLKLQGAKTISTVTPAVPTWWNMTLDTWPGGSYLNYKAYAHRFYDYQDNLRATLDVNGNLSTVGTMSPQQASSAPTYVKWAIYFDTTLNKLRVWGATGWETITSS